MLFLKEMLPKWDGYMLKKLSCWQYQGWRCWGGVRTKEYKQKDCCWSVLTAVTKAIKHQMSKLRKIDKCDKTPDVKIEKKWTKQNTVASHYHHCLISGWKNKLRVCVMFNFEFKTFRMEKQIEKGFLCSLLWVESLMKKPFSLSPRDSRATSKLHQTQSSHRSYGL